MTKATTVEIRSDEDEERLTTRTKECRYNGTFPEKLDRVHMLRVGVRVRVWR